jgi:hypothetical protein
MSGTYIKSVKHDTIPVAIYCRYVVDFAHEEARSES